MSSVKKVKKPAAEAPRKRHVAIGRKPTKASKLKPKPKRRPAATASSKAVRRPASKSKPKPRRRPAVSKPATLLVVPPVHDVPVVPARPAGITETQNALAQAEHDCLHALGHTCVAMVMGAPRTVWWCHKAPCAGAAAVGHAAPPYVTPPPWSVPAAPVIRPIVYPPSAAGTASSSAAWPRGDAVLPDPWTALGVQPPVPRHLHRHPRREAQEQLIAATELARCKIMGGFSPWATPTDDELVKCMEAGGHKCAAIGMENELVWCEQQICDYDDEYSA
jgi:hypothetical protein